MKKVVRFLSYFFFVLLGLGLIVGNIFYPVLQPILHKSLVRVFPLESDVPSSSLDRYDVDVTLAKNILLRYEPLSFSVVVRGRKSRDIVSNALVRVQLIDEYGNVVRDIHQRDEVWIRYNPETANWSGTWYPNIAFNGEKSTLRVSVQFDEPIEPVVITRDLAFLQRSKTKTIGSGLTFFFVEEMESLSRRSLLSLNNEEKDWNVFPQWMNFLAVDGVFVMGGVTRFLEEYSFQDPWNGQKLQEALTITRWASSQNRRAGVWVRAFRGDGNLVGDTGYDAAWYQKDNQWLQDVSTISFAADSRYKALQGILSSLDQQDGVSYVGLADYFFFDDYGMELAVRFVETEGVSLPQDWDTRNWEQKLAFARSYVGNGQNYQVFLQWKRYYLVNKLREILRSVRKPVFYVVNWDDLVAQPELFALLDSAGVDFFVVQLSMPYKDFIDSGKKILELAFVRPYLSRIVWVNQIQYKNFVLSSTVSSSIDGFVALNEEVVKSSGELQPALGLGVNFYKSMYGNRGPYTPIEWLMGAGESFRRVRAIRQKFPLDVDVLVPKEITTNTFQVRIRLINRSSFALEKVVVEHVPTRMVRVNGTPSLVWNTIAPGESSEALMSFSLDTASDKFVRQDLFVVLRVSWGSGGKTDSFIVLRSFIQSNAFQPGNITNAGQ